MKKVKTIIFIIFIATILLFSRNSVVRAETNFKEINYSKSVAGEQLEDIKIDLGHVLDIFNHKVMTNPNLDEIDKYYYNQLTNDVSRNTYNTLSTQTSNSVAVSLNNLEYTIEDMTNENIIQCFESNILPYIADGFEAYVMDDATNYWWCGDIKFGNLNLNQRENKIIFKDVEIISNMEEWSDYTNFNTKLEEVSNSINGNSVYEIVTAINNYICNNVEYKVIEDTDIEQTAYGALIKNQAVCEGQAKLFNLLCRKKGVISINVNGFTNDGDYSTAHAWNYVYEPSKKKWYAVDVTWNNNYSSNIYLMVGNNTVILGKEFRENHLPGFKQYDIQTYVPSSPALALDKYSEIEEIDETYVQSVQPNTTSTEFLSIVGKGTVQEGESNVLGTSLIKTGQTLIVGNNTYTIVVLGDANGDGQANISDILSINRHRLNKAKLTKEYLLAGDVNRDEIVDIKDILQINKYRLGRIDSL